MSSDVILGPEGAVANSALVYVPSGSPLAGRVRYPDADGARVRALAATVLQDLLALNEPAVLLPVLGWFYATPFKTRIQRILQHFPILVVWGTQGSGKSSLVKEVFWPLFGVTSNDPFSATETEFAMLSLLASTNGVPLFIDEYKPSDMPVARLNTLHRYLRRLYGGEVEGRGRSDQTVTSYLLSAPVCLAGEARPDDPALVDRLVAVAPDRNRLDQFPEHVQAFHRLRAGDLGLLSRAYITFALGRDTTRDLEAAVALADSVLDRLDDAPSITLRCRDNLRVVVFGLNMFEAFARELGVALPPLDVEVALAACVGEVMDGERGGKSPLDRFIEACATLAYNGVLVEEQHYAVVDGLTCLHLRSCWDAYLLSRHRMGQAEEVAGLAPLRRLLKESRARGGYVRELSKTVTLRDQRVRTVAFDLREAGKLLDIDPFPAKMNRTWGGTREP